MRRTGYRVSLIALLALVGVLGVSGVLVTTGQAQDINVEFVGVVESAAGDTITVNGQAINFSGASMALWPQVGNVVRVQGWMDASGAVFASRITFLDDDEGPQQIEIVGQVDSVNPSLIAVNGFVFSLTGAEIDLGIDVGARVRVEGFVGGDGIWVAREVHLASAVGQVQAPVSTPEVGFGGDNSSGSRIGDNNDDSSGSRIGDNNDDSSGSRGDNNDNSSGGLGSGRDFELTGTLTAFDSQTVTVAGQVFRLADGAQVVGQWIPGAVVRIEGDFVNGELLIQEVRYATFDPDGFDARFGRGDDRSGRGDDDSRRSNDDNSMAGNNDNSIAGNNDNSSGSRSGDNSDDSSGSRSNDDAPSASQSGGDDSSGSGSR